MAKDPKQPRLPNVPGDAIPKGPRTGKDAKQARFQRLPSGEATPQGPAANPSTNQRNIPGMASRPVGTTNRIPAGPPSSGGAMCADVLANAFRGRGVLTEAEIRLVTEEIQRRYAGRQGGLNMRDEEFQRIAREIALEVRETAAVERRNTRINAAAKQRLLDMADEAARLYDDPSIGLEAAAVGTNRPLSGNRLSADARGQTLFAQYLGMMISELERGGLLPHLNTGYLDLEIARALEKLTKPEARGSTHPHANQIAEIIHKHRKLAFDRENRAGAWRKPLPGYIAGQFWDMAKVRRAGFEAWRDYVLPRLDHERTFKGANPQTFLREAYRTLANGEELSFKEAKVDLDLAFKGPGNLAKRASQHRVLHFKDADAWVDANSQYGRSTMRGAIMAEFEIAARDTAVMETFGTNPRAMFEDVKDTIKRKHSDRPEVVDQLDRSLLRYEMLAILGDADVAANPTMASFGAGSRAFISAAKLGGAVISSVFGDTVFKMAAIRYMNGGGVLTPFSQAFGTFFQGLGRQAKETADLIGAGLDGHSAGLARFAGTDATVGTGSRMLRTFFKWNLLTPWTDANKRGLGLYTSRMLARHAATAFDQLPEHMRFLLSQFEIDAPKWEVARQAVATMSDGKTYMLPHLLRDLPNEALIRHGLDPVTGRDGLESAIRTLFTDMTEMGVPTPGARERAILNWGTRPGTPEGEALRFIGQFKAFPVTVVSRSLGRLRYGNPGGKADLQGLAMVLASSIVLGYAAMSAKSVLRGQTPRDPLDYKTWIAAFVQGGGAGIYGDLLLGETNRFGRSLLDTMAGPGLGVLADIDELRARLMFGDDVAATALRLALNNTPFINMFYSRLALDYLILFQLQEMANPGYLKRRERQLKKEQGQQFILPAPSRVIPRGGGRIFEGVR
jgi:hypothetical protein